MKKGRPKIELSDLPEGWEELILSESKKGASIVELSVLLGICRDTFYTLCEREPHFFDTVKKCKQLCEAWWVKKGRTQLENKDFSYTGWYMNMKNRFNWTDKQQNENLNKNINLSDLSEEDFNKRLEQAKKVLGG